MSYTYVVNHEKKYPHFKTDHYGINIFRILWWNKIAQS